MDVPAPPRRWLSGLTGPVPAKVDVAMLRNCDTRHYMENKGRMVRLAEYSRDCLKASRESTGIQV